MDDPHAAAYARIIGPGTLYDSLRELENIYAELDGRTAEFARSSGLSCPAGCGTCCSNFEPDITEPEAAYVALHLFTAAPELFDRLAAAGRQACVFYEPDGLYHCSIYKARPLVCRAFGFSSSVLKDGRPHFAGCKHMPGAKDAKYDHGEAAHRPPVMPDYGVRVSALSTGGRTALRDAVPRAVSSLGLKMKLASPAALPSHESLCGGGLPG